MSTNNPQTPNPGRNWWEIFTLVPITAAPPSAAPRPAAEKKDLWEIFTRVAVIAAVFVAIVGYLQLSDLNTKMEKAVEKLGGKVEKLNDEITNAKVEVVRAQKDFDTAAKDTTRLLTQTKKDADSAKQEISAKKDELERLTSETRNNLKDADELLKALLKLQPQDRKLLLEACSNLKATDIGQLREDIKGVQANLDTLIKVDWEIPVTLNLNRDADRNGQPVFHHDKIEEVNLSHWNAKMPQYGSEVLAVHIEWVKTKDERPYLEFTKYLGYRVEKKNQVVIRCRATDKKRGSPGLDLNPYEYGTLKLRVTVVYR